MAKEKKDYLNKEKKELLKELKDIESKLLETKMSFSQGKVKDSHSSRKLRKEIARIKGSLKMKELGV
jgi:ribosomal protein L29